MKQGSAVIRSITLLLLAAVLLYLGVSAWNSLRVPFSTFLSYSWSVDDTVECTGYVVREETVLTGGSGLVDLLPNEGEKVAKGELVAMIYQSEAGLDRQQAHQSLLLEREQLQYALHHPGRQRFFRGCHRPSRPDAQVRPRPFQKGSPPAGRAGRRRGWR